MREKTEREALRDSSKDISQKFQEAQDSLARMEAKVARLEQREGALLRERDRALLDVEEARSPLLSL